VNPDCGLPNRVRAFRRLASLAFSRQYDWVPDRVSVGAALERAVTARFQQWRTTAREAVEPDATRLATMCARVAASPSPRAWMGSPSEEALGPSATWRDAIWVAALIGLAPLLETLFVLPDDVRRVILDAAREVRASPT